MQASCPAPMLGTTMEPAPAPTMRARMGPLKRETTIASAVHTPSCVRPSMPLPSTLPSIRSHGRAQETTTSMTRLDFSRTTERITVTP